MQEGDRKVTMRCFHSPLPNRQQQRGSILLEMVVSTAIFLTLLLAAGSFLEQTAAASRWSVQQALAEHYISRETAVMRKLDRTALNAEGFTGGGGTVTENVPLAFLANGDPDKYFASRVIRAEVDNGDNSFTYTVGLEFRLLYPTERVYRKAAAVSRRFE
jgi:type II secretory pathway component PulJ